MPGMWWNSGSNVLMVFSVYVPMNVLMVFSAHVAINHYQSARSFHNFLFPITYTSQCQHSNITFIHGHIACSRVVARTLFVNQICTRKVTSIQFCEFLIKMQFFPIFIFAMPAPPTILLCVLKMATT